MDAELVFGGHDGALSATTTGLALLPKSGSVRVIGTETCLGHLPQVLSGGGRVELISCAIWASQAQAIQLQ
ncbi:hypothetical protein, partial [Sphingomonas sp. Root1294]|uniref:hypothetical protein n=1 Tax=Sphingomonas sp. Root1294 TaxID=1736447 RepID=UPI0039E0E1EE